MKVRACSLDVVDSGLDVLDGGSRTTGVLGASKVRFSVPTMEFVWEAADIEGGKKVTFLVGSDGEPVVVVMGGAREEVDQILQERARRQAELEADMMKRTTEEELDKLVRLSRSTVQAMEEEASKKQSNLKPVRDPTREAVVQSLQEATLEMERQIKAMEDADILSPSPPPPLPPPNPISLSASSSSSSSSLSFPPLPPQSLLDALSSTACSPSPLSTSSSPSTASCMSIASSLSVSSASSSCSSPTPSLTVTPAVTISSYGEDVVTGIKRVSTPSKFEARTSLSSAKPPIISPKPSLPPVGSSSTSSSTSNSITSSSATSSLVNGNGIYHTKLYNPMKSRPQAVGSLNTSSSSSTSSVSSFTSSSPPSSLSSTTSTMSSLTPSPPPSLPSPSSPRPPSFEDIRSTGSLDNKREISPSGSSTKVKVGVAAQIRRWEQFSEGSLEALKTATLERAKKRRQKEILDNLRRQVEAARVQAAESARVQAEREEEVWMEQERKAKEAERRIREIARRAREEHRRASQSRPEPHCLHSRHESASPQPLAPPSQPHTDHHSPIPPQAINHNIAGGNYNMGRPNVVIKNCIIGHSNGDINGNIKMTDEINNKNHNNLHNHHHNNSFGSNNSTTTTISTTSSSTGVSSLMTKGGGSGGCVTTTCVKQRLRPPKPPSRAAIIAWFRDEELPRRAGLDHTGTKVAGWFHGIISRTEAEEVLVNEEVGSFLVRVSERIWGYAISYKAPDRCRHYLIDVTGGKYTFFGSHQLSHNTLGDLVEYHKQEPITAMGAEYLTLPCGQSNPKCPDHLELFTGTQYISI
ncbi:uncharacterized protein LOC143020272 isoform X2 [Oratosquilla oratoria]|uniref:uncharacterized protein LOC143020272 isoform X2 n=1 Tax=Oratosquilla oratoria TaxID=337810 RepID=UPI003F75A8BD